MSVTPGLDGSVQITAGAYSFNADCPECKTRIVLPVELATRLTVTGSEGGKIRPFMSSKSVEHSCGAPAQKPLFEGSGAPPFDTAGDPEDDPFVDTEWDTAGDQDDDDEPGIVDVQLPA